NFEDPFGPKPPGFRGIYISPLPRRARVCPFRDCARGERFRVQALFLFLGVPTGFDSVIMIAKFSLWMCEEPGEREPIAVGCMVELVRRDRPAVPEPDEEARSRREGDRRHQEGTGGTKLRSRPGAGHAGTAGSAQHRSL